MISTRTLVLTITSITLFIACGKQDTTLEKSVNGSINQVYQISYSQKVKFGLKESLSAIDYALIDFNRLYISKDIQTPYYFLRLGFIGKSMAYDFLLLRTDSVGNIIKGKIVHINDEAKSQDRKTKDELHSFSGEVITCSLNRRDSMTRTVNETNTTTTGSTDLYASPRLPDVVVTCYLPNDYISTLWYWYGGMLDTYSQTNTGTYTYGPNNPDTYNQGGGAGGIHPDQTIDIEVEGTSNPAINLQSYLKCFSNIPNKGASYKISIFTDIPVNGSPYKLFNFSTGSCGHTFLQLTKSGSGQTMQQSIGFYPQSGWKSIEASAPVASKLVDNAGHEYNGSLTISLDSAHFQTAINKMLYLGKLKYDIDNFNCTDYALEVFNVAAPIYLDIPQYHIPGGMLGELSNTPQGLYNKLFSLYEESGPGGYPGGTMQISSKAIYVGSSHGACN
jgi:hypothetical protein